jgi:hypothetical protein
MGSYTYKTDVEPILIIYNQDTAKIRHLFVDPAELVAYLDEAPLIFFDILFEAMSH